MTDTLVNKIFKNEEGSYVYVGDTFRIVMNRYSDPDRLNLARNAAIYLGKSDRDNIRRPLRILRDGHVTAIFRGENVEFEFIDVSKEVYDHIITYTTANMRAAGGNRALVSSDYTMPSDRMKNPDMIKNNIEKSMAAYKESLDGKESRQVARSAMPIAAKMNPFVFQFNFVTLGESVFKQRIWEKGAQSNTAKVVQGMYELCKKMDNDLWEAFYQHKGTPVVAWGEVRKRLQKEQLTINELIQELSNLDEEVSQNGDKNIVDYLIERSGGLTSMW